MSCNCCPPQFPEGECINSVRANNSYACSLNDEWSVTINAGVLSGSYFLPQTLFGGVKLGTLLTQNIIDVMGGPVTFNCSAFPPVHQCAIGNDPALMGVFPGGDGKIGCYPNAIGVCAVFGNSPTTLPMPCGPGQTASSGSARITLECSSFIRCSTIIVNADVRAFAKLNGPIRGTFQEVFVNTVCQWRISFIPNFNHRKFTLYKSARPGLFHQQQIITFPNPVLYMPQIVQSVHDIYAAWPDTITIERQ